LAHDVFISYASGDKPVADAVCAALEAGGVRCWIAPRDVMPGIHYGEAIIDAIHECRIMVLVFSSKANLSGHIPKEIERAVSQGSTVMPLRIENVAPAKSLDYFIGSVHWLDALTPPLEAHLRKLVADVQTLLSRSLPPEEAKSRFTVEHPATSVPPTLPVATDAASNARPGWIHVVIGGLSATVAVLGFLMLRSRFQSPPATSQNATQTVAGAPANPTTEPTPAATAAKTPAPASKKAATPAEAPTAPAAKPELSEPAPPKASAPLNLSSAAPPGRMRELVFQRANGATTKLEQLIGDEDKERHEPTRNQTFTKYGLQGAELGYSFEHQGHAYFLFGDVIGRAGRGLDTVARTDTTEPEQGVNLEFLPAGPAAKNFLTIHPSGINMGPGAVPVAGIDLNGQMYVTIRTGPGDTGPQRSMLTKVTLPNVFQPLRNISELPNGHFIKMSLHADPAPAAGLPPGGPFILVWGTGKYRESDAYLSVVPAAQFESGEGTQYFAGLNAAGAPTWSTNESDAKPIVKDGTLGDISVTWCKDLKFWLMTYDRRSSGGNGIAFRYSPTPWGPWSEPQLIFNAVLDGGLGHFIHNPNLQKDDGVAGPVFGAQKQENPGAVRGGNYAPYVVERWTRVQGSELDVYYVMSTLNPYVVVLMKSRLRIE
jgi:hypothetical protein